MIGWFRLRSQKKKEGIAITYEADVYLLNGARTPFGKFCGTLSRINPTDLGIIAAREALQRSRVPPQDVDQVIFANVTQSSFDAIYLPRHVGLYCGIPRSVPASLVQRICGSGIETVIQGVEQIILGKADVILTGGSENMSLNPTVCYGNRLGYDLGQVKFIDLLWESLLDPASGCTMGMTAENLATDLNLTRDEVDEYALRSHQLALESTRNGTLQEEMKVVESSVLEVPGLRPRKYHTTPKNKSLYQDEHVRETNMEALSRLKPVFKKDGVQTAGNSSGIVDGAASNVIASKSYVHQNELQPLARIVASAVAGVEPSRMGIGPVAAINALLESVGMSLDDVDLFEINEAFAAQYLAVEKMLGLERDKVNVNGGAIAIGHPLAATGARLILTLALELKRRKLRYGIASACIGGGQGNAILIENVEKAE